MSQFDNLIAILIIVVFILIFAWIVWRVSIRGQANTQLSIIPNVGFGYECRELQCNVPLECDSRYAVCKYREGSTCKFNDDCVNDSYCSGICVTQDPQLITNRAQDPCPCNANARCVTVVNTTKKVCKLITGRDCTVNSDCISGTCSNGTCSPLGGPGSVCSTTSQCATNLQCSFFQGTGYCQQNGVESGENGAFCTTDNMPGCDAGLSCKNSICVVSNKGLSNTCSNDCAAPLICLDDSFKVGDGICYLPFTDADIPSAITIPDPNSCSITGICETNYICDDNGVCGGSFEQPCVFDLDCDKGSCQGNIGAIFQLSFVIPSGGGTKVVTEPKLSFGSISMEWKLFNTLSLQDVIADNVRKLVFYQDVPSYVVLNQGLFSNGVVIVSNVGIPSLRFLDCHPFTFQNKRNLIILYQSVLGKVLYTFDSGNRIVFPFGDDQGLQRFGGQNIDIVSVYARKSNIIIEDSQKRTFVSRGTSSWALVNLPMGSTKAQFYANGIDDIAYINSGSVNYHMGPLKGLKYPKYDNIEYEIIDYSVNETALIINALPAGLGQDRNTVFIVSDGILQPVQGFFSNVSKVLVSDSYYIYSRRNCDL